MGNLVAGSFDQLIAAVVWKPEGYVRGHYVPCPAQQLRDGTEH